MTTELQTPRAVVPLINAMLVWNPPRAENENKSDDPGDKTMTTNTPSTTPKYDAAIDALERMDRMGETIATCTDLELLFRIAQNKTPELQLQAIRLRAEREAERLFFGRARRNPQRTAFLKRMRSKP